MWYEESFVFNLECKFGMRGRKWVIELVRWFSNIKGLCEMVNVEVVGVD